MVACAPGAVILFALGAFDELRDAWRHPDHHAAEDHHVDWQWYIDCLRNQLASPHR